MSGASLVTVRAVKSVQERAERESLRHLALSLLGTALDSALDAGHLNALDKVLLRCNEQDDHRHGDES